MKKLYLIRGLPGAGKGHIAKTIMQGREQHIVSADDYFMDPDGVYRFDGTQLQRAHDECANRVRQKMIGGTEAIAVRNTFVFLWHMRIYIEMARFYNYEVEIIEVKTTLTDAQLAERNIYGVGEQKIAQLRESWQSLDPIDVVMQFGHRPDSVVYPRHPRVSGNYNRRS